MLNYLRLHHKLRIGISMKIFYKLRRLILKNFIPELIWPIGVLIDDVFIKIRNQPYSFGVKYLLTKMPEKYELPERLLVKKYISKGANVLELGASIGILSRIVSNIIGESGRLISVEADPSLASHLKKTVAKIPNIEVVNAYAFPLMHSVNLQCSFKDDNGSLGGIVSFEQAKNDLKYTQKSCFFIEDSINLNNFHPDVLIMDIEGSELIMLDHVPNFPLSLQQIIAEFHPSIYGAKLEQDLVDILFQEGFECVDKIKDSYYFERISV